MGLWDVDGNGLSKIEDPDLANAFVDKVNDYMFKSGGQVFLATSVFAFLPQSVVARATFCVLTIAALYFAQGKIPPQA